jgi:hypothetical protein
MPSLKSHLLNDSVKDGAAEPLHSFVALYEVGAALNLLQNSLSKS